MTIRKFLNWWYGKKRSGFYVFLGLCSAGIYLAGTISATPDLLALALKRTGFLSFPAITLAFFIHMNLNAAHWFLEHFKDTDHLPRKQISLVNSFSMTLFLTLTLAALPASSFVLGPLWQAIGRWLSDRTSLDKAVYPALYMETEPAGAPDLSALLGEAKPTPQWIIMLDKIFRMAGTITIGFFIILAIWRLFVHIWAWITKPRYFDSDEKIYLTPTWSLSPSGSASEKQQKKRKGFQPSYDRKIRQRYRREILSRYGKIHRSPALSASPAELEETAGLKDPTLHTLYEKARYSQNGCTKADWETLLEAGPSPTSEA